MGAVHGLQVSHGIPVVLHKHHGVGARQVQAQTPDVGGEQQHVDGGVVVEPERSPTVRSVHACDSLERRRRPPPGHDGVAQARGHAAVQPQVRDGGQFGLQQVVLHDVQHAL